MAGRTETLVRTQRELLQAVSHELRTPLSRIRFASDLIARRRMTRNVSDGWQSLEAATEELDKLVGELLSYVRAGDNPPQFESEPIALRDVLDVLIPKHAPCIPPFSSRWTKA